MGKSLQAKKKRLNKLVKAGKITRREADERLSQSKATRATDVSLPLYPRIPVGSRTMPRRALVTKRKQTGPVYSRKGIYSAGYYNDYLACLTAPWERKAHLPDIYGLFPSILRTIKTTCECTPLAGDICVRFIPRLNNFGKVYSGTVVVDGAAHTSISAPDFAVHAYSTDWAPAVAPINAFRPVAMGLKADYTGPMLDNAGQIAAACLPPDRNALSLPDTFNEIADYVYSAIGPLRDGVDCIWVPQGQTGQGWFRTDDTTTIDEPGVATIRVGVDGALSTSSLRITVWMVIEVLSISQTFLSGGDDVEMDMLKAGEAHNIVATLHKAGRTAKAGKDRHSKGGSSFLSDAFGIARKGASWLWDHGDVVSDIATGAIDALSLL
jgi:hypothetical protein